MKHRKTLEHSPFDAMISALGVETSALMQSFWQYRRGVSSNCRLGITPQMCNRVANHGDMGTFSKPVQSHRQPDVVAKKGIGSCFVPIPNTIVHNFLLCTKMHHLDMILFRSNMNHSHSFMVLLCCHVWHITDSLSFVYILSSKSPKGILFIKRYFQIKITNNLQRV